MAQRRASATRRTDTASARSRSRATDGPGPLRRLGRRLAWPSVVAASVLAVVFVGVFPTRTYLEKRQAIADASAELDALDAENAAMQQRLDRLDTDEEIERVAREQYGLVKPGEEVYRVLPEQQDPITMPDGWPFEQLRKRLGAAPPLPDGAASATTTTVAAASGLPPARD